MNELKSPSFFEIKQFIKDQEFIEFKLINNDVLCGKICWFDETSFHIELKNNKKITMLKSAIVYYSKK